MNEAGDSGYAVLSLHVNTAEMGRYESFDRQARVPVYGLLATDGFAAAAIAYGLSPDYRDLLERSRSDSGFLDAMLARIRDVEEGDPDCRRYLRFKKGDDATAVVFEAQA